MSKARYPVALFANGVGDHLLTLPALRALASLFPERLGLICLRGMREVFFSDLPLRVVCEVDPGPPGRAYDENAEEMVEKIGLCDLFLCLNPWHSPAVVELLRRLSPARSVGFFPSFEVTLPLDYSKHSSELAFTVPCFLDPSLRIENFSLAPTLPVVSRQMAQEVRNLIPPSYRVLALHADTKPEKMWPADRLRRLLDAFLDRYEDVVVLHVGLPEKIRLGGGRHADRIIPCLGLPLPHTLALVGEADLFLGVDSSMLHAADLFRIPGVGLFGPTCSAEFGFRFGPHRHVCGNGSMSAIREEDVLEALSVLMAKNADMQGDGMKVGDEP